VIGIIGILMALTLPAVQSAREAGRRTSCVNNLKNLAIAMQNYHAQFREFPPAAPIHHVEGKPSISWRVIILPFIEESPLYDRIRPLPDGGATDWTYKDMVLPLYKCPSAEPPDADDNEIIEAHYAGVSGAARGEERFDLEDNIGGDVYRNGVMYPDSSVSSAKITDGTTHTLMIGERLYVFRDWMQGATWWGDPLTYLYTEAAKNIRWPINTDQLEHAYVGDMRAPSNANRDVVLNDLYFASKHPGGAQFALADGSVQFLNDRIDISVLQDLATRKGEEIVSGDLY
jgi:prepilin-type processing-associated H-X9-DG protein